MARLWAMLLALVFVMASCTTGPREGIAGPAAHQERGAAEGNVPSLTPPKGPDDPWSQGLVGEWESSAESDLGRFKGWVKGRGRMTAEMGLGGHFLIMKMEGHTTALSDEYARYLRETQHASEEDIRRLQDLKFESLELLTTNPKTGEVVAYLFDSWRCVAKGAGKREGDREVIQWEWSVGGQGTSERTTDKVGDDRLTIVERYALPDGGSMEDRVQMTRRR